MNRIIAFTNIVLFLLLVAVIFVDSFSPKVADNDIHSDKLPTQHQIQQALADRGYDIKVDGVIGKASREAWDEVICNQYAEEYFEK